MSGVLESRAQFASLVEKKYSDWTEPSGAVALTLGVIALIALGHLFGIRLASHVNNVGVWTELIGVTIISLVLIDIALAQHLQTRFKSAAGGA